MKIQGAQISYFDKFSPFNYFEMLCLQNAITNPPSIYIFKCRQIMITQRREEKKYGKEKHIKMY
jgi:hypothetical protein